MKNIIIAFFTGLLLTGCNGSSGENTTPIDDVQVTNPTLTLKLGDSECNDVDSASFPADENVCVQAKLSQNGLVLNNQRISFSTSLGEVTVDSALTNSDGWATVYIANETLAVGAATVTATYDSLSQSSNYEFVAVESPVLSLTMGDAQCNAVELNSFPANQSICIQVQLNKGEQGLSNELIDFSTSIGELSVSSALTNADGQATVFIANESLQLGAATITATYESLSQSANYEFLAVVEPVLSFEMGDANCNTVELTSFLANESICITAKLTQGDQAISNQIVNFATTLGELSSASGLTDAEGEASITIANESLLVGAATVTASVDELTSSLNYEFLAVSTELPALPSLSLSLINNDNVTNRFKAGETIQLEMRLLDANNQALANQIVNFSVEKGTLKTDSALTNNEGFAQATLTATDADLGAGVAQVNTEIDSVIYTANTNYEVLEADAIEDDSAIKVGAFNQNGDFEEGVLGVSLTTNQDGSVDLAAGGTMGLSVAIVDEDNQRILTPTPIAFTSSCVANAQAAIDAQVNTINGVAQSTYEDISCAGGNGNQDVIVASVIINNVTTSLTREVNLSAETLGSIEFVSATPESIVLKGTGGEGKQETSTLTFQVKGSLGNALSQQPVDFTLDTEVGGLTVNPTSALTNSQGFVSTRVTSGNVPTVVRVSAVTTNNNDTVQSQSDLLSVNTGLADQNSITLSAVTANSETENFTGTEVDISAYLSDAFNNPVPDGTVVNFTTEGGQIQPSCQTENGRCTVVWTSSLPRVSNHRITVLATAIGHETFFDTNGNNVFDNSDGTALTNNISSGFNRSSYQASGFNDLSEAWRDDNEDGVYQQGEIFLDFNNNNTFDAPDTKFNGPQCTNDTMCDAENSLHVRKAITLIMASSSAEWDFYNSSETFTSTYQTGTGTPITIPSGGSQSFSLNVFDTAFQVMPRGTVIAVTVTAGEIEGDTQFEVPNTIGGSDPTARYGHTLSFSLNNIEVTNALLEWTITTPQGITTKGVYPIVYL